MFESALRSFVLESGPFNEFFSSLSKTKSESVIGICSWFTLASRPINSADLNICSLSFSLLFQRRLLFFYSLALIRQHSLWGQQRQQLNRQMLEAFNCWPIDRTRNAWRANVNAITHTANWPVCHPSSERERGQQWRTLPKEEQFNENLPCFLQNLAKALKTYSKCSAQSRPKPNSGPANSQRERIWKKSSLKH